MMTTQEDLAEIKAALDATLQRVVKNSSHDHRIVQLNMLGGVALDALHDAGKAVESFKTEKFVVVIDPKLEEVMNAFKEAAQKIDHGLTVLGKLIE